MIGCMFGDDPNVIGVELARWFHMPDRVEDFGPEIDDFDAWAHVGALLYDAGEMFQCDYVLVPVDTVHGRRFVLSVENVSGV